MGLVMTVVRSRPGELNFEGMGPDSIGGGGIFEVFVFFVKSVSLCDCIEKFETFEKNLLFLGAINSRCLS